MDNWFAIGPIFIYGGADTKSYVGCRSNLDLVDGQTEYSRLCIGMVLQSESEVTTGHNLERAQKSKKQIQSKLQ